MKLDNKIVNILKRSRIQKTLRRILHRLSGTRFSVPNKLDMLVVEITTYCTLKCAGCVRTILSQQEKWKNQHISLENYRKLIDDLPPANLFIPQGIGEPTLHPHIVELIRYASDSKKFDKIEINTNGLVRTVEYYEQLFAAGLSSLCVSVDSLNPDILPTVRGGTDAQKLESFLRAFAGKLGIRVTVSAWNLSDLSNLLDKLNSIGQMNVWLQPFFNMGNPDGVMSPEQAKGLLERLDSYNEKYNFLDISAEPMEPSAEICLAPWRSPAICADGTVKPCCLLLYQDPIKFGNAFVEPFQEIWHSKRLDAFRREFLKKSPACCRDCPYYVMRK